MRLPTPKGRPHAGASRSQSEDCCAGAPPDWLGPEGPYRTGSVAGLRFTSEDVPRGPPPVGVPKDAGRRQVPSPLPSEDGRLLSVGSVPRSEDLVSSPVPGSLLSRRKGLCLAANSLHRALVGRRRRNLPPPRRVASVHFGGGPDSASANPRPTLLPGGSCVGCRRDSLRRAPPVRSCFHPSRRRGLYKCFVLRWRSSEEVRSAGSRRSVCPEG